MRIEQERRDCAPPEHPSSATPNIAHESIDFELALMVAMGGTTSATASAWIATYAARVRDILDTDADILALVHSKQYDIAIARIVPLLKH